MNNKEFNWKRTHICFYLVCNKRTHIEAFLKGKNVTIYILTNGLPANCVNNGQIFIYNTFDSTDFLHVYWLLPLMSRITFFKIKLFLKCFLGFHYCLLFTVFICLYFMCFDSYRWQKYNKILRLYWFLSNWQDNSNWITYNLGYSLTIFCMANYVFQQIIECWIKNEKANYEKLLLFEHSIRLKILLNDSSHWVDFWIKYISNGMSLRFQHCTHTLLQTVFINQRCSEWIHESRVHS